MPGRPHSTRRRYARPRFRRRPDRETCAAQRELLTLVRRYGHILRRRSRLEGRMNETDRHGALADRGRAAFDRSAPNISRGEDARQTRLEEKRPSALCPPEIAAHG